MRRFAAALAVAAATLAPAADGQGKDARVREDAKATKGASAPAEELARTLVSERAWNQMIDAFTQSLTRQIEAGLAQQGGTPPQGLAAKVRTELADALRWAQGVELQAKALSQRFTPEELRSIVGFYRSGPGQKLLRELPELARTVDQQIQALLQERVPRIVEKVAPSLAAAQQHPGGTQATPAPGAAPGAGGAPAPGAGAPPSGGNAKGSVPPGTPPARP